MPSNSGGACRPVSIPDRAGGLSVSRSKRLMRVANAAPVGLSHLYGGRSFPEVHLVAPLIFLLLVTDVLPYRRLIPAYGRNKVSSRPEALPCVVLLPFSVYSRKGNRALALHESHDLRRCIFRGYRQTVNNPSANPSGPIRNRKTTGKVRVARDPGTILRGAADQPLPPSESRLDTFSWPTHCSG